MGTIRISRHDFLKGFSAAAGLGAFGGARLFAVPSGWTPAKKPNLVFGVMSDTHLRTVHGSSGRPDPNWPDKFFLAALAYFRAANVDAVVHCGDFAHRGQLEEMQFHARVWESVFPKNLAPDGHEVVKLFITGNHDTEGAAYGDFVAKNYPDPEDRAKHVLQTDMPGNWERIWREKYEPVWHREVKGYHFFGRNHKVEEGEAASVLEKHAPLLSGNEASGRPFFYLQHSRPLGDMRRILLRYRENNPVAFFGHNHWSASNWNVISLYSGSLPCIQVPSCEPRGCSSLADDAWIAKGKLEKPPQVGKGRQGFIVRVYDDMMVIARREFGEGGSLGPDWMMPFEKNGAHPLSKEELKKAIGKPQFKNDAELAVTAVGAKGDAPPSVEIAIPLADANPESRVYAYDVVVAGASKPKLFKSVYAAGCNLGMGHEPDGGVTTLAIPLSQLPQGDELTFAVRPLSSLGTFGKAIAVRFRRPASA